MLVAPTGSGKTIILASIIQSSASKGKRVLFMAPRRELIHQACEKLRLAGVEHGIIMAGENARGYLPVQVACVPTLVKRARNGLPHFDLVIQDEAHIAVGGEGGALLKSFQCPRIGLTATPARTDGLGLGELYDELVLGPSVADLTEHGFLVPVRYFAPSKPDLDGVKVTAGDYNQKQLGDRMDQVKLIGDVVENWARICPDRKTLVASVTVAHSMHLRDAFRAVGVKAEHVDGETPHDERAQLFRRFKDGDFQVLCNCEITTYGYDEPSVQCIVLAKPTKSIARYLQIVGRGLRPFPGKDDIILIDHSGAVDELGYVDDVFPWSLDGKEKVQERKAAERKEPRPMTCSSCKAVFKPARHCPMCGAECGGAYAKAIKAHEASLIEVTRKGEKKHELTMEQKNRFYRELQFVGNERGYKSSYADAVFRERFGVWCGDKRGGPLPPSPATVSYLKHLSIKRAKARQADQRVA